MVARLLCVFSGLLGLGVCPGIAQSTLTGPTLGLFFDPKAHAIRPIWGIPGSSTAGQPIDVGFPLAAGIISPSQDYALVVAGDGSMSSVTFAANGPSLNPIRIATAPDRMVISPGGKSAAFYYSTSSSVQILTNLPDSPQMAGQVDLSSLPNSPDVIAISDDGSLLLVGVRENADGSTAQGEVFAFTPDTAAPRSVASVQHVAAIAFVSQSHDALLADDVASSVTLVSDVANRANVAWTFASQQLPAPDPDRSGLGRRPESGGGPQQAALGHLLGPAAAALLRVRRRGLVPAYQQQVLHGFSSLHHDERGLPHEDHASRLIRLRPASVPTPPYPRTHPKMACMSITREEVAHLARLARISLSDAELDHLAPQLDQIITSVAQVQEVAADGIPPTSHATGVTNVFRDDVPVPCLTPEQALDQAPAVEQQRFKVPRILGED